MLNAVTHELRLIRYRLDDIEKTLTNFSPKPVAVQENALLDLPDHLRRSYLVVASKGECDAITVSNQTGRCRAIESNYLNQLTRSRWLLKRHKGRIVMFRLAPQNHSNR
jgi:hypothetical protein